MAVSASSEDQKRKLLTQLQQLRQSPGWKLLLADLKELLTATERAIMTKGGNEVQFSSKDLLIERRDLIQGLISKPEAMIGDLTASETGFVEEHDPYGP